MLSSDVLPLDYRCAQFPVLCWVEMLFDGIEWRPALPVAMPHHHATRLELSNLAAFPALEDPDVRRLRFTLEATSREIRKVDGRPEWRVIWHARIISVCAPKDAPA